MFDSKNFFSSLTRFGTVPKIIINALVPAIILLYSWYFNLPAINVYSMEFWSTLEFATVATLVAHFLLFKKNALARINKRNVAPYVAIALIIPVVIVVGTVVSSKIFNAQKYATVIDIKESAFNEDMPKSDATSVGNIALMDTDSAIIKGKTTLGSLSELVSQFRVNEQYSQINYQRTPQKVSNLEYDDFFKWINNKASGIPGYVMVDPVNNTAKYVKLDTPLKYVESGFFGDDLYRKLRFEYPTKIFGSVYFEIDEKGDPYYVVSCMEPKVGLFGAMDVAEVIIFNPVDGSSEKYKVDENPYTWIDCVYTGNLACQKYDWYGTLSGGFINSIIGNKDCKQTTDDFGYLVIEDDVWYYTGVTSVTADTSNIGFILSNARTGEYKFYPVVGAEEHSAMGSAEGQVQEKGYKASFPSLINVYGEATYIMVLKDVNGIVKLYALVNVQNYSFAATGVTQTEAFNAYKKLLVDNGILSSESEEDDRPQVEITVEDVRVILVGGESVAYITAEDGKVYKGRIDLDEKLVLIRKGDKLLVSSYETENDGIYMSTSWSFAE